MVRGERNISSAISGNDRWVESIGSRRSSATVKAEAPRVYEPRVRESSASRSSACRTKTPRPGRRMRISSTPAKGPRRGEVEQGQVTLRQFQPRLNSEMRQRIRQGWPKTLRPGQFRTGAPLVTLVHRYPRGHGTQDRDRGIVLEVGLTGHGPGLGEVPFAQVPCPWRSPSSARSAAFSGLALCRGSVSICGRCYRCIGRCGRGGRLVWRSGP
jgi:hypothetical protein